MGYNPTRVAAVSAGAQLSVQYPQPTSGSRLEASSLPHQLSQSAQASAGEKLRTQLNPKEQPPGRSRLDQENANTCIEDMESPYSNLPPTAQQTLNLFSGKWASQLPPPLSQCEAGSAALFQDPRVPWAVEKLAGFGIEVSKSAVLELGPLEGGHTYSLSKAGAQSVTAVEANSEAYLKCLVTKELLGMERVNFLYGDAVEFLRHTGNTYDLIFASGFLYHLTNPVELLELACRHSRALFLWTVYWDRQFQERNPGKMAGSGPAHRAEHAGFVHTLHRHDYGEHINYTQFWGGSARHSYWMELEDILSALRHFGFGKQSYELETNPNGNALRLVAASDRHC
jgi:hypothetical protein